MTGPGRLAENDLIVAAAMEAMGASQELARETVLVTAGPTREKIDPFVILPIVRAAAWDTPWPKPRCVAVREFCW